MGLFDFLGGGDPQKQIDKIKRHPNVLILTTSNISEAIDLAFIDRADIKLYIGPPSQRAIYEMLHSCVSELVRCGYTDIVSSHQMRVSD